MACGASRSKCARLGAYMPRPRLPRRGSACVLTPGRMSSRAWGTGTASSTCSLRGVSCRRRRAAWRSFFCWLSGCMAETKTSATAGQSSIGKTVPTQRARQRQVGAAW
eukprot:scaffold269351_cov22-Tisochrysis_lutea.AAC.2